MIHSMTFTIARFTVLETWRARLFLWSVVVSFVAAIGGFFLAELAITDVARIKAGLLGGPLRVAAVFTIATLVVTAIVREQNDKITELLLSLAVPRPKLLIGKLLGFIACAWLMALIFALPLMPVPRALSDPAWMGWLTWTLSLALELSLMTGIALLAVLTFGQVAIALGVTFGFYLLSRLMSDLQLIAHSGMANDQITSRISDKLLAGLGLLLPRLDQFTRSEWLVDGLASANLSSVVGQVVVYLALLTAVGLWDLYRREW
jgi:ABC-type transport system involved in multi-copper enzyme maturation permease subunit